MKLDDVRTDNSIEGLRVGDAGHTIFGPKREDGSLPLTIARNLSPAWAKKLVQRYNAFPALAEALDDICNLPADDSGERIIPAGFLDSARAALKEAGL